MKAFVRGTPVSKMLSAWAADYSVSGGIARRAPLQGAHELFSIDQTPSSQTPSSENQILGIEF